MQESHKKTLYKKTTGLFQGGKYKIDAVKFKDTIQDYLQRIVNKKETEKKYRETNNIEKKINKIKNEFKSTIIEQQVQNSYIEFYLDYKTENGIDANALAELNSDNTKETLQFYFEQKMDYAKNIIRKFHIGPYTKNSQGIKSYSYHYTSAFSKFPHSKVPDRPFFSPVIQLYKDIALRKAYQNMESNLKSYTPKERNVVAFSKNFIHDFYENFGLQMIYFYQNWFDTRGKGTWAPNSDITLKFKSGNSPMIDSGGLQNALKYRIHIEGHAKGKSYRGRFKWSSVAREENKNIQDIFSKD